MAVQRFSGFVYTGAGVAVVGATIDIFARNTLTAQTTVPATVTTDANGYFTATVAAETRCDVRITNGSSIAWLKYDDEIQIEGIEVAVLRLRNPADTFDYDIVPAAIVADRQLTLPLTTATETLAVLGAGGLAQTFENATLLTPTIAATGWTNANHAHAAANSGGVVSATIISRLTSNSGTSTTTAAHNMDTVAISGLAAGDVLMVIASISQLTQNALGAMTLYNDTDAVTVATLLASAIAASALEGATSHVMQHQEAATSIRSVTVQGQGLLVATTGVTFTTAWTGAWTLAFRSGGQTAGGTHRWRWSVYRLIAA